MKTPISEVVGSMPIVDVHEHHIPEVLQNRNVGLVQLLKQSYAGWTQARPYPLPGEARDLDPMLEESGPGSWSEVRAYVEGSGSSMFVRNLVGAITTLYEVPEGEIRESNWERVDRAIREKHQNPDWANAVLKRAGIESIITDPYTDPLMDARARLGEDYRGVMRINAFACGWHAQSRDHNGNSAFELLARLGWVPTCFEEYVEALGAVVDSLGSRNQVALKNALAYDRDVSFDEPDEALARQAWGIEKPDARQRKAFGDFVVDHLCRLAGERDIPVQMHLGTAIIRGSHPLRAAGLIERHPRTRFLLMHLAYPWSRDLLGMAFVYRNIWIDLTWSMLLSPSHFKLALHEAIEILPDESRMMVGGDNWHVEETFGTMGTVRRLLGEVLEEKRAAGYFRERDGIRLAEKILRTNAIEFFRVLPRRVWSGL
jgi:uncharacterized protein